MQRHTKPKVAVYGDSMLDISVRSAKFNTTQEDHTVPILPTPPLTYDTTTPGGAANLAINLAAMGCDVTLLTSLGTDAVGMHLLEQLEVHNVKTHSLFASNKTTTKTRYYSEGRLIARHDNNGYVKKDEIELAINFQAMYGKFDALVISDYGKGMVDSQHILKSIQPIAPITFYDPYLGRMEFLAGLTLDTLVLNWEEAKSMGYYPGWFTGPSSLLDATELSRYIYNKFTDINSVIVKRGCYGSVLVTSRTSVFSIEPYKPSTLGDAQGAGDTYLAGYVTGRLRGLNLQGACNMASIAAGLAVSKPGTAIISLSDIASAVVVENKNLSGQILSYENAIKEAKKLKAMGLKIGYTNGCFDLRINEAHRFVINKAQSLCDVLFVGIDSDKRVKELKGETRPVINEKERVDSIAALRGVHKAFIFDNSPLEVLTELQPDVLFKGGSYTRDNMPELQTELWKGDFVNVGSLSSTSTTELINHLSVSPEEK